ncbi:MAG: sulfatase-like hydrolase/transferase, partial [Verrucomicrobiota bacterium]
MLFCISDDQSFPHASAYGTTWVKTPAFDRVAREGLLFMRAYTPNAKCAPSRASILTGRYSWQLEEAANHSPDFPAKFRTFMEALAAHGYATGWTGKGWSPGDPGQV